MDFGSRDTVVLQSLKLIIHKMIVLPENYCFNRMMRVLNYLNEFNSPSDGLVSILIKA